jgi:AcrR family transcriptional regulator
MTGDGGSVPSTATRRRSQTERRAETERRILLAATHLIADRGLAGTSLRDVGLEAGYSRGIVNHHFGTKEELVRAVIMHAQRTFALPTTDATGLDLLLLTVERYIDYLRERRPAGQAFLLLWAAAVGSESSLRAMFVERDTWFRDLLAGHVREGIKEGSVRTDANPAAAATAILGMLRGIGLQLMLMPADEPLEVVRDNAADTIRHGLASRMPPARPPSAEPG